MQSKFIFPKNTPTLTLCLLVSSADNLCKQLGARLFGTLIVFLSFFV